MQKTYIINEYNNGRPDKRDDFYGYVNYEWIKNNSIPDYSDELIIRTEVNLLLLR